MIPKNSAQALFGLTLVTACALAACTEELDERTDTQRATASVIDPTGRPVTDEEIAMITRTAAFAAAQEIVTEDGQQVDLSRGLVYTYSDIQGTETRFGVSGRTLDTYPDLVFQQIEQDPANCYFVDPNAPTDKLALAGATGTGGGAALGGDKTTNTPCVFGPPWSNWTTLGYSCQYHFWCFFHGQKATYRLEKRTRNCSFPKQTMTETRLSFEHCGC